MKSLPFRLKPAVIILIAVLLVLVGTAGLITLIVLSANNETHYIGYSSNHFLAFLNSKGLTSFLQLFAASIISGFVLLLCCAFTLKKNDK